MAEILRVPYLGLKQSNPAHQTAKLLVSVTGSITPRQLTAAHVLEADHVICNSGYAHPTRTAKANSLRRILRWLWEEHGAKKLDDHVRKHPGLRPRNITATFTEREKLLDAAPPHMRLWILLCSDLAIRSGTASNLGSRHYNAERGELRFITKLGARLMLPLTQAARDLINTCDMESGVSFVRQLWIRDWNGTGRAPSPRSTDGTRLAAQFRQLCLSQGITRRVVCHDLRRTAAVGMYEETRDLRDVQALLGHRSLQSTIWYLDHDLRPVSRANLELIKGRKTTQQEQIA